MAIVVCIDAVHLLRPLFLFRFFRYVAVSVCGVDLSKDREVCICQRKLDPADRSFHLLEVLSSIDDEGYR